MGVVCMCSVCMLRVCALCVRVACVCIVCVCVCVCVCVRARTSACVLKKGISTLLSICVRHDAQCVIPLTLLSFPTKGELKIAIT